jgi:DNA helicase-2/ATP-dependent DNA helicase PcrA
MAESWKIFGPPGTGKTTKLLKLLEQELKRVDPDRIAFLTHTNAAADVIADRAGKDASRRHFRTIHSACAKRLGLSKENIVDPVDYRAFSKHTGFKILSERADGLVDDGAFYAANNFAPVLRAYDLARLTSRNIRDVIREMPTHPSLARSEAFIREWEAYKTRNGLFDFTDMLGKYLESEIGPLPCDAVFLDEGQDLSMLQWKVFEKFIGEAKRVYIAGDDDQAIYSFMGGSEFGFLDYKTTHEIILSRSHRVPAEIGLRATKVIRRVGRRKEKNVTWKKHKGELARVNLSLLNLNWRAWANSGKHVMVLTRHRRAAFDASADLAKVAVPHALGTNSLHNSPIAKIVRDFYLVKHGKKIPWRRMKKLLDAAGAQEEAARVLSIGSLKKEIDFGRADVKLQWDSPEWVRLFSSSRDEIKKMRQIAEMIKREGIEVIGATPTISVMTMHAAKGREADIVVILPDCNEIVWKNRNSATELRLAYVALTRAKEKVLILSPQTNRFNPNLTGA